MQSKSQSIVQSTVQSPAFTVTTKNAIADGVCDFRAKISILFLLIAQ